MKSVVIAKTGEGSVMTLVNMRATDQKLISFENDLKSLGGQIETAIFTNDDLYFYRKALEACLLELRDYTKRYPNDYTGYSVLLCRKVGRFARRCLARDIEVTDELAHACLVFHLEEINHN